MKRYKWKKTGRIFGLERYKSKWPELKLGIIYKMDKYKNRYSYELTKTSKMFEWNSSFF